MYQSYLFNIIFGQATSLLFVFLGHKLFGGNGNAFFAQECLKSPTLRALGLLAADSHPFGPLVAAVGAQLHLLFPAAHRFLFVGLFLADGRIGHILVVGGDLVVLGGVRQGLLLQLLPLRIEGRAWLVGENHHAVLVPRTHLLPTAGGQTVVQLFVVVRHVLEVELQGSDNGLVSLLFLSEAVNQEVSLLDRLFLLLHL